MIKFLLFSIFILDFFIFSKNIEIKGDKDLFSVLEFSSNIDSTLVSYGYFDSKSYTRNDTLFILSGERYLFNYIKLSGNPFYNEKIINNKFDIDFPFSKLNINKLMKRIENYYQNRGYPFVKISLERVDLDRENRVVTPILNIESGDYVNISRVIFNGNKVSKNHIIERELRLNLPSMFSLSKLEYGKSMLYNTNLFSFEPTYKIFKDKNKKYMVLFNLEEENYNSLDGMLGYSSKNDEDKLFGYIDLEFRNLFGTFRGAKIYWQRLRGSSEEIELNYREPWLYNIPISSYIGFTQIKEDSLYLDRGISINFEYFLNQNFTISTGFNYNRVFPINKESNSEVESSERKGYNLSVSYKTTVYKNPFRELFLSTTVYFNDLYKKFLESGESNHMLNSKLETSFVKPMGRFSISSRNITNHLFFKNSPEYLELLNFGGVSSFRGVREKFISTTSYSSFQNNLYFDLKNSSYIYIMFDLAIYSKKNESFIEDFNTLYSLGGGLKFPIKTGGFEIIYAFPLDQGFSNSVIHARLLTEF
ncbi:MAG: hypothetical protein CR982_00105 [Candidatus Cloacimonadota bacterium]|nr:MAG: hypothetical protein CR982_00105 [Candidatus Cloacimonadota bacterium]PIE78326.1 MAG: hypothetical protein CSA15_08295 [Candidatus Delongbacteria bacterium]